MHKLKKNAVTILIAVMLAMTVSACGYHISGRGGLVPEGAATIAVPVFFNGTSEPYVDVEVTQAVVDEFLTDGRLRIVSLEEADLVLRGTITNYDVTALSYNPQSYAQQYRVHITVDASLEDQRSKKVLWQERSIRSSLISDYAVAMGNVSATRVSKDAAIKKASQDIAWTLRSRVLEGF
ncbi:MAG: hypothetical protein A2010_01820 [Nitrospirae bacterium GWD2_57_9]|nr:MAG: hypothetical protein A2010_01820 [Nitrospirae bacterium GWD2_57_9]OGW46158.1 MAG: hypothetical protein A2078_09715 [Nitrospirae bacterium GWC2_57_9]